MRTSSPVLAKPGQKVTYTVRLRNTGDVPRADVTFTDDLSGLLDDAVLGPGLSATSGTVSFEAPEVTWTGDLAAGHAVTLTYDIVVNDPPAGDLRLSTEPAGPGGAACGSGPGDPPCEGAEAPGLPLLYVLMTADHDRAVPGEVVTYTVTVGNVGTAAYQGASLTGLLSRVLDDATYNGDARATHGVVSYVAPRLVWTGDVPAGDTVTITYGVTVNAPGTGDRVLDSAVQAGGGGTNCPAPAPAPMPGAGTGAGAARLSGPVPGTNLGCAQRIPVEDATIPPKQVPEEVPAAGADAAPEEATAVAADVVPEVNALTGADAVPEVNAVTGADAVAGVNAVTADTVTGVNAVTGTEASPGEVPAAGADAVLEEAPAGSEGTRGGPVPSRRAGDHLDEEAGGFLEPDAEGPFPAACGVGGSCDPAVVPVLPFTGSRLDPLPAGLSLILLGLVLRRCTRRGAP
ncbi:hypothetical protein ACLQ2R_04710 [Streptosporangium sp. DT93]|uniref:DUF7927 domain-containing protein n=1 Tax=Streptosporangium sp. DT93 TaxID=3393428 RepID=UPI003CEC76EF